MLFFITTFTTVGIMLLYAVPGYLVVKSKLVSTKSIAGFATVLMYVCTPCMVASAILRTDFSKDIALNIGLFFLISMLIMVSFSLIFYLVFRKRYDDARYRVYTMCTFLGNCSFMGIPLLEAIFPDKPVAVAYSIAFFLAMNIICWTFGSYIISGDRKFISLKKMILNPAVISVLIAIPVWIIGIKIPSKLMDAISLMGKMTTPMCMLVLGMRLATMSFKSVFGIKFQYAIIALKQICMPLLAFVILYLLPLDPVVEQTLFIICCTPVASVVLNFAEMLGKGQETAANCVLLGSLLSLVTIPVLSLLIPYM